MSLINGRITDPANPLLWKCTVCPGFHPVEEFAPTNTQSVQSQSLATYQDALAITVAATDQTSQAFTNALATLSRVCTKSCLPCRQAALAKLSTSPAVIAVTTRYEEIKRERFHTCGRCGATRAIQCNHLPSFADNKLAYEANKALVGAAQANVNFPAAERKIEKVSKLSYWSAANRGVPALEKEFDKCEPVCAMCHVMDPSSSSAPENLANPDTMIQLPGESNKTFGNRRGNARRKVEKRNYVNALKRKIGRCERPGGCPNPTDGPAREGECVAGFEQLYDFDHIKNGEEKVWISELVRGDKSLAGIKPTIFKEICVPETFDVDTDDMPPAAKRRCRMLCKNCHEMRKEWD